jgi:hypothetical protein
MPDLTVVYYTANVLREPFFSRSRKQLAQAADDLPIISVSQKPLDFGENICVDLSRSYLNIYRQILIGARAAETEFVALAEDDTLYSKEHFTAHRPKADEFAYNMSRWSLYTWTKAPVYYSIKYHRHSNSALIAPRELLIEALEERFAKYPDDTTAPLHYWGEPGRYERVLGVTVRKAVEFFSPVPIITFSHPDAIGYEIQGTRKAPGELKAYDIPVWGKAEDVLRIWQ